MTDYVIPIPEWLNHIFLEKSVRKYLQKPSISIKSFTIEPATGKGENYASLMYRVKLIYSGSDKNQKSENFIVKVPYESGMGLDLLDEMDAYDKELEMYETILPRLTKLLRANNMHEDIFAATIYVSCSKKAIVFEDLSVKGYRMAERNNGMDMTHSRMVLRKLAIFHAANAVLQEQEPQIFENFKHGMLNRKNSTFEVFYSTSLAAMTDLISTWPNFSHIAKKLRTLQSNLMENGKKAFDARPHQFNTLIHGDIWMNNIMFRYNSANKQPENTMLVDFQFCCWSSPTIDLHYFMNTSMEEDLRLQRQDELVQYYHSVLVEALRKFNYHQRIPTLQELHIDFVTTMFYAFMSASLVQPLFLNENCEDADIEALHGNDERAVRFKHLMYTNKQVQANLRNLLPIFERKGILD